MGLSSSSPSPFSCSSTASCEVLPLTSVSTPPGPLECDLTLRKFGLDREGVSLLQKSSLCLFLPEWRHEDVGEGLVPSDGDTGELIDVPDEQVWEKWGMVSKGDSSPSSSSVCLLSSFWGDVLAHDNGDLASSSALPSVRFAVMLTIVGCSLFLSFMIRSTDPPIFLAWTEGTGRSDESISIDAFAAATNFGRSARHQRTIVALVPLTQTVDTDPSVCFSKAPNFIMFFEK